MQRQKIAYLKQKLYDEIHHTVFCFSQSLSRQSRAVEMDGVKEAFCEPHQQVLLV